MNRYINRNGYVVRKSSLSEAEVRRIRKDLTVSPLCQITGVPRVFFKIYRENDAKIYVPRFYGTEILGVPENVEEEVLDSPDVFPSFLGSLRPDQVEVAEIYVKQLKDHPGGILQLPCGFGKTVVAISILAQLGVKTVIVVHKTFLLNQWIERLETFLDHPRIGVIQQNKIEVEGKDIVIAMLQSVCQKDYAPDTFKGFGLAIYDECHHLGAEMFCRAFRKIVPRWCLGLSATPNRKDGLRKVFEWHLGRVIVQKDPASRASDMGVSVRILRFADDRLFEQPYSTRTRAALINHVCDSEKRNLLLLDTLRELLLNDPERRILVLSERRSQLLFLFQGMEDGIGGFYVGGMKQTELNESAKKQVVFGTFQMASEGMDIAALNTVILCSPKTDIEQSVGRILRTTAHAVHPLIVDIVDTNYENFMRQFSSRKKFYRAMGFVMEQI